MSLRFGLLGGTFDPVHRAHLALAFAAMRQLSLDQVWWVPVGKPWQKKRPITAAQHRVAMLKCALQDEPRFILEPCELLRQGPSYTIDTIALLQSRYPSVEWVLLLGQDQYQGFTTWVEWQTIVKQVTIAVAERSEHSWMANPSDMPVQTIPYQRVIMPLDGVSSTQIRQAVAMGHLIEDWVQPCVAEYIRLHGLYQSSQNT